MSTLTPIIVTATITEPIIKAAGKEKLNDDPVPLCELLVEDRTINVALPEVGRLFESPA
jgi:hypothetical protein